MKISFQYLHDVCSQGNFVKDMKIDDLIPEGLGLDKLKLENPEENIVIKSK